MKKLTTVLAITATLFAGLAHADPADVYEEVLDSCKGKHEMVQCMLAKYRLASKEDTAYAAAKLVAVFEYMEQYAAANEFYETYKLAVSIRTPGQALKLAYDVGTSHMTPKK